MQNENALPVDFRRLWISSACGAIVLNVILI